jgi:hypothetical protein
MWISIGTFGLGYVKYLTDVRGLEVVDENFLTISQVGPLRTGVLKEVRFGAEVMTALSARRARE